MLRCKRSLAALLIAVLFGISVVGHGFAATSMSMSMTGAMPADMSADNSMDCDGKDVRKPNCFALCAGAIAILPDPAPLPVAAMVQAVADAPARFLPSQDRSPEPYPPKPLILT